MSKMKLLILLLLFIGYVNNASSQNVGSELEQEDYYLDIDRKEVFFKDIDTDSVIINVNTNTQWRVEASDRWIITENITDTSFTIKSTQNHVGYRIGSVRIIGSTSAGSSIFTSVKVDQAIAVPSQFSADIDVNDENNVTLKWSKYTWQAAPGDEIYYEIYRDSVLIATTSDTFFVEEKTMLAGEFYYNISAVQRTAAGVVTKSAFSPKGIVFIKNPLIVTANTISRYVGFTNPNVSGSYNITGFIDDENITYLSKRPVATIDPYKYHNSLPVGTYPDAVEVAGGEDNTGKYRFIYTYSNLIVLPLSNNAGLSSVTVNGTTSSTVPSYYAVDCSNMKDEIDIIVNTSHSYATVKLISDNSTAHISGKKITVNTSKPSKQEVAFEIVAQDGVTSTKHRIIIERYFVFDDIVTKRLGIALVANNNLSENGGYNFLTYKWYRDNQLVGTEQTYSSKDDTNGTYYLEVTTDKGEVLRTCDETISLNSNLIMLAPTDFVAKLDENDENNVVLTWEPDNYLVEPDDKIYYEIYRDDKLIGSTENTFFVEEKTMLAGSFNYNVRAIRETPDGIIIESPFTPYETVFLKIPLIVTANSITRYVGFSNPDVSSQYSISGFSGTDDISYLSKRPVATIDPLKYHMSIPVNTYKDAIEVSASEDNTGKYRFMYVYADLIVIPLSDDADLSNVIVDGITTSTLPEYYAIDCSNMKNEIDIVVNPNHNYATVNLISDNNTAHISGNKITVNTNKPSKQEVVFEIIAQDGVTSTKHRIIIERYFSFNDIVINRWDIALTAINNPVNNGGYNFLTYKWYRDNQLIGTSQSYSSEEKINGTFYLEVTTDKGELLRTCDETISLKGNIVKAYPNPVALGQTIYVEADFDEELLKGAVIEIYDLSGVKFKEKKVTGKITEITLSGAAGTYIFKFKGQDGLSKDLKVIRK